MRLVDLNPQWLTHNGQRIGMVFHCPLEPDNLQRLQAVFFSPTPRGVQRAAIEEVFGQNSRRIVQCCNPSKGWTCTPALSEATFETISVLPSIDGSAGGNWHGWIRNGEAVNA